MYEIDMFDFDVVPDKVAMSMAMKAERNGTGERQAWK
jgi:hypothetical protein